MIVPIEPSSSVLACPSSATDLDARMTCVKVSSLCSKLRRLFTQGHRMGETVEHGIIV